MSPETASGTAAAQTVGQQFMIRFEEFWQSIQASLGDLLWNLAAVCVILLIAKFVMGLVSRGTSRVMRDARYHKEEGQGRRVDTLMTLVRSVARYAIYFFAILLVLDQFGFAKPLSALIAAAGVGSLAIGFGAQNLVKDVVTGFFMIFENQFSVGDYIQIDNDVGTVEATAMRVTYLRTFKGEQVIIPNGTITRVINYTRGCSVAQITISTAYEADTRQVLNIIQEAVDTYAAQNPDLVLEAPVVQGITALAASSVDIGVICKTPAMSQWQVERGLRLAIKETFDRKGVEFPYPRMVLAPYAPGAPSAQSGHAPWDEQQQIPHWAEPGEDDDDTH